MADIPPPNPNLPPSPPPGDYESYMRERGIPSADPRSFFAEEGYIQKMQLLSSEYRAILLDIVRFETISTRAKQAYYILVNQLFDKAAVLGKTTDLERRKILMEIGLNKVRSAFTKVDTMNPAVLIIDDNIRQHFDDYISRAVGGWERTLQNVKEQSISYSGIPNPNQNPAGKGRGLHFPKFGGDED